jgi:demethylspheroidene O-methyltransferase
MPPKAEDAGLMPERASPFAPSSWIDRCFAARDSLLASPRFQRWAAGFPMTRKIAQKRALSLFDLCAGFVYSQVLAACVKLKLFDILAEQPQTVAQLSRRLSLPLDRTTRLLAAAVSLRLVERRSHERFGLGVLGAALRGNPAIAAMVEHHALLYADLRDPVALLRGECPDTALSEYWPYARESQPSHLASEQVAPYGALMFASQSMIAGDVLDAYPLRTHRRLLDVGGGEGAFVIEAASRTPHLHFALFDLPPVAERARSRFANAQIAARTTVAGGDFFHDALPEGADVVTLVRVIHDHDDAAVLALLRNIRRVLPPDGVLLIAEPMSATAGAETVTDAYFGFYLLAMGSGRARSPDELGRLLQAAGFEAGRLLTTRRTMLVSAMVAKTEKKK